MRKRPCFHYGGGQPQVREEQNRLLPQRPQKTYTPHHIFACPITQHYPDFQEFIHQDQTKEHYLSKQRNKSYLLTNMTINETDMLTSVRGKGKALDPAITPSRGGNQRQPYIWGCCHLKRGYLIFQTAFEKESQPPGRKSEHQQGSELEGELV